MGIFFIGAGGHCKMVLDALRSQVEQEQSIFSVDDYICLDRVPTQSQLLGVSIQQETDERIASLIQKRYAGFVAIGDNTLRQKLLRKIRSMGASIATIVASSAVVSPWARIGTGTIVMPGAVLGADVTVGEGCIINTSSSVDHDGRLDNFTHLCPGVHLAGEVHVGEGAMLGTGCSVIPRCKIGKWSVVGAGAVVLKHIPERQTWIGCPARPIDKIKKAA